MRSTWAEPPNSTAVEDDEIVLPGPEPVDGARAVPGDIHREALRRQAGGDRLGDGSFVLDPQYPAFLHGVRL
ncbi:hypothetical protein [Micromonospora sp. RTP1Z1]|uniref:hypothetical protein n=1 Tax=Micromonospora sp. RTP1Z1 TaxID=2994043 RepID=UPI0029C882A9|nr:hypothetical protein [Micromonospora sp. RTP1Z1]